MIRKVLVFTLAIALASTAGAATWTWTGGAGTTDWYGTGNWSTDGATYTNNPTQQYVGVSGTGPATPPNFLYLNSDVTGITISGATVDKTVNDATTYLTSNSLVAGGTNPTITLDSAARLNLGGNLYLADDTGAVGGVTGQLDVLGGSTLAVTGTTARIGAAGGTGTLNVAGGSTATFGGTLDIGFRGTGTATFTGAGTSVSAVTRVRVGNANNDVLPSSGTLNVEAGAKLTTPSLYVGVWPNTVSGYMHITGDGSTVTNSGLTRAGDSGAGTITVDAGGTLTTGTLEIGRFATGSGTVNINSGGTVNAGALTMGVGSTSATASLLNFDGGTLRATGSSNSYLADSNGTAPSHAYVKSGGATIDTGANNIVVKMALEAAPASSGGGLTKNGAGQLVLFSGANTYTGPTTLNAGTLVAYTSSGYSLGAMTVKKDAVLTAGMWDETNNVIVSDQSVGTADLSTSSLTFDDGAKMTAVLLDYFGSIGGATTVTTGALAASGSSATVSVGFAGSTPTGAGSYAIVNYTTNNGVTFLPRVDAIGTLGVGISDNGGGVVSVNLANIDTHWTSGGANQNYTTTANWSSYVPNGANKRALFDGAGETVNLDTNVALSSLTFNPGSGGFSLNPVSTNQLTLDSTIAVNAMINNMAGSNTIGAPITLNKNADVVIAQDTTLTFNGAITGDKILAKTGAGTLALSDASVLGIDFALTGGALQYTGSSQTATGRAMTLNGPMTIRADSPTGVMTVNGAVAANGVLTKLGEGTVKFASPSGTHNLGPQLLVNGGTLELAGGVGTAYSVASTSRSYVGDVGGASGTLAMSGNATLAFDTAELRVGCTGEEGAVAVGTVNLSGGDATTPGAKLMANGGANFGIFAYSEGSLNIHDYAEFVTPTGKLLAVGDMYQTASGVGHLLVDGHGKLTVDNVSIGQFDFGDGDATLKDSATVTVSGSAYVGWKSGIGDLTVTDATDVNMTIGGGLYVGYGANTAGLRGTGSMTITDGTTITAGQAIFAGNANNGGGNATVTMTGGSITTTGLFAVARGSDCSGSLTMSGNASIESTSSWVAAGNVYGGVTDGGALGGTISMSGNATLKSAGDVLVGWGGSGTLNIGDGTPTDNAVVTAGTGVLLGHGTSLLDTYATVNLNGGGTLETPKIYNTQADGVAGPNSSVLNFDGGTLKATAASADFIANDAAATVFGVNVRAGGATIDTNGYDVTINAALAEDTASTGGGLTKKGLGTLTLTGDNTYSGDTVVQAGALSIDAAMLYDDANLALAVGSVMNLNFTGTDEIAGLLFGNSAQALGTWGATGSGAAHVNDTYFTGTGMVLVTEKPITIRIPGDTNGDLIVDTTDAQKLAQYWGAPVTPDDYTKGDFNNDGMVNAADASIMAANWGNHTGEGTGAVPEPSTVVLLLAGLGVAMLKRRCRR